MEKEKGGKKGKKVIFSITKDLSRFLIPYQEGISRWSRREKWPATSRDEGF